MSRTSLFDMYLAIFTHSFAIFTQFFFGASINLKGLVCFFYIFQRLIHIFKDDFTKFKDYSRTKALLSNSSFPGPRSNLRTFPGLCEPCHQLGCICGYKNYIHIFWNLINELRNRDQMLADHFVTFWQQVKQVAFQ